MDTDINKEQKLIQSSAREFLKAECPKDMIREMEESKEGYSPELWHKIAELGWIGLNIPEEYNGMGMNFLDLVVLLEEIGYNLMPGPFFSTVMCAIPIAESGTEEQKNIYLPGIAEGKLKLALAITEPMGTYRPEGILAEAVREGNDYIINGTKLFVDYGHVADCFLCPVRTKKDAKPEDGISLFIIDSRIPGITIDVMPTMGLDKQCAISFSDVRISGKNILGEWNKGWKIVEKIMEKAQAGKCAEMVGGIQASLDMTNIYVKKRITYGRPVGSNQVIQHYLANVWIGQETSRNVTYFAAWKISEGMSCALEVSAAKAYVGKVFTGATERCVQMHGAMGLTREHDIGLYYRQAKACEVAFGDEAHQQEIISREMNF